MGGVNSTKDTPLDSYRDIPHDSTCSEDDGCGHEGGITENIDWNMVETGEAAGLPGEWVRVSPTTSDSQQQLRNAIGDELSEALTLKASAYSNKEWQAYWDTYGLYYLVQSWQTTYPGVSLKQLKTIDGLEDLCVAMEAMMSTSVANTESGNEDQTGHQDQTGHENQTGHEDQTGHVDQTGHEDQTVHKDQTGPEDQTGHEDQTELSSEDFLSIWNTFYNEIYWSAFMQYTGQDGSIQASTSQEQQPCEESNKVEELEMVSQFSCELMFYKIILEFL